MPLLIGAAIRDGRYIVESLLSEEELSNIYVVLDTQEPEKKYSLEELVLPEGEEAPSVKEAFIQNAVMQMQREDEPAPEGEVKVYDVFEENDTAYCVKDFPDGFVPEPPVKSTNPRSLSGAVEGAGLVVDAVSSVVKPVVSVGSSIPNVVGGIGAVISGDSEEEKEEKTVEPAEEPMEAPIEASADEHAEDAVAVEEPEEQPEEEPTDEPEEAVAEADDVPEGETAEDAVETTAEDEEEVEAVVVPVAEEETEDKTRPISVEINVFINEVHKEKAEPQPVQPVAEKKRRPGCLLWTILILLLLTLGAAAYIYFVPFSEKPAQPAPHQTDSTSVGDTLSPHDTLSPRDTIVPRDTPVLSDTLVYVVPTVPTPSDKTDTINISDKKSPAATIPPTTIAPPKGNEKTPQISKDFVLEISGVSYPMVFVQNEDEGFFIGKYEVTQDLWLAVMNTNPSRFVGNKRPVENVSYGDCHAFLQKLNSLSSQKYRLPMETEWEYAANGGIHYSKYAYSGADEIDTVAWYFNNSGKMTHEVGGKAANALGIYDMSGNVCEWCETVKIVQEQMPKVRGGSWNNLPSMCALESINFYSETYKSAEIGFRIVLDKE